MAAENLTANVCAFKICVQNAIPVIVGNFCVGNGRIDSGTVHQNVGTAAGVEGC